MLASRYSNTDSTENTIKILLEHSNTDIKLQNNNGMSALMLASRYSDTDSTERTIKLFRMSKFWM
jgi:ankyrin repeat protein